MRGDVRGKNGGTLRDEGREGSGGGKGEIERKEITSQLEDKEVRVKEEKQLQSVFCFHKMTTVHKSLKFGVH